METDYKGCSPSFTVITGAVDNPRITETIPTHKKVTSKNYKGFILLGTS